MTSNNSEKSNNLYAVLGLKKECTTTELRTAYKKLALRWHPDRWSSMGNSEYVEEAKQKFQAIQEAYSVLSDSDKRFLYDVEAFNNNSDDFDDDDDNDDQNGMGDFMNEMAAMMNQHKPSENSFEELQDLFNEMFQGDTAAFSSPCSASSFASSFSFVFDTNQQQSPFETSSMGSNDPFGFESRAHAFSPGVEQQKDFKKGKKNERRRNIRRKNNVQSSNNHGVHTS